MQISSRLALGLCSLVCAFAAGRAFAEPVSNDNAGTWLDDYPDNLGVDYQPWPDDSPKTSSTIIHDAAGQAMVLQSTATSGFFTTRVIQPASFTNWKAIYLKYTAQGAEDVRVQLLSETGTALTQPVAPGASDDAAWSGKIDISSLTAAQLARARVKIYLAKGTQAGAVAPTLQALRVDWVPLSVVKVTYEQPQTACTRATISNRVRVSVSHVDATNLVVWAPLPEGVLTPSLNPSNSRLELQDASDNGVFTSSPVEVDGVTVPANSVYWRLGQRKSGNTFVLSFNTRTPGGILNSTTYTSKAFARAANSAQAESGNATTTVAGNYINRQFQKSASPVYRLFNENWANASRPGAPTVLTYNVNVWSYANTSTCLENWTRVVVWDELDGFKLPSGGNGYVGSPSNITGGGVYTATGTTLFNNTNDPSQQAVTIPANSIYWIVDSIAPGESRNFQFSVTLAEAPPLVATGDRAGRTLLKNTARVDSGYKPQVSRVTQPFDVRIGVPFEPSGTYAKGDRIRGAGGISYGNNDIPWLNVGYGEPVTYLMLAANSGASALTGTWMIDRVPDGMTFSSAFLPGGANGRIFYGNQANGATDPPAFPLTSTDCAGTPPSGWVTTPPSDLSTVKWIAWCVPRLSSPYFPEANVPTSVTAEFTATVNPPTDGCAEKTLTNVGYFQTFGYATPDGSYASGMGRVSDTEYTNVKPLVPSLQYTSASASPGTVLGAREVDFSFYIPNQLPGGSETDTALEVTAVIQLPSVNVGGTNRTLELVSYDLGGGTPDLSGIPTGTLRVSWPTIGPGQSKRVSVRVRVPKGLIDNTQVRASANITGRDDVCGPVTASASATATVRVNPYLQVSKSVNLAIAAIGSELIYGLNYLNTGDGASTGSWVVDHIPVGTKFVSASNPTRGETWWFSKSLPPTLPPTVREDFYPFTDTFIRTSGHFTQGVLSNGRIVAPFPASDTVTWVAVNIDNKNLSPVQLPTTETGIPTTLDFRVLITNAIQNGATIANEGSIFSNQLVAAISNQALTIVSPNPSLAVARTCPEVVANGEDFVVRTVYTNNSSNQDDSVTVTETLPAGFVFAGVELTFAGQTSTDQSHITLGAVQADGSRTLTWVVARPTGQASQLGRPLGSLESVTLRVRGETEDVESGQQVAFKGLGSATNVSLPQGVSVFSQCQIPVENPDLWVRIFADQPAPLPNESVNYTVLLSNQGRNDGNALIFEVTLPSDVEYVPGSVLITTPGWSFTPNTEPTISNGVLRWSLTTNALTKSGNPAGYMPGTSGDIQITFRGKLKNNTAPNKTLTVCAESRLGDGSVEDPNFENSACVEVRTPQPDPYIEKVAPALAQPGGTVSYRLRYGNDSRMPATRVVLFDSLYDDPVPAPDGKPDIKFLGATASNGEEVFFSDALIGQNPPAFNYDLQNPTGWKRSPSELAGPVSWVAVRIGNMAGNQPPRSVFLDVELRNPTTGATPLPGSTIRNCATAGAAGPNPPPDDDTTNNRACVDTRTPGIDITLVHDCDPKGGFPGVRPGGTMTLTLTMTNSGTQPAHGLSIRDQLPSWFEVISDDAQTVAVVDATGGPSKPIDGQGLPINDPVPWTRTAQGWTLGSTQATSPYYYRRVGLAAGASTTIRVTGSIANAISNNTPVSNTATAVTEYREDWQEGDPAEENLTNNLASCGTTVYRPDVMVLKFAADLNGGSGPVGNRDRIQYTIEYNNIGQALADTVVLEDVLPVGTAFVAGSLQDVPDGAEVQWAGDDGVWKGMGELVVATGDIAPQVKSLRMVWDSGASCGAGNPCAEEGEVCVAGQCRDPGLRAPTNNYFRQTTALDFQSGTFAGTKIDEEREAVAVSGRGGAVGGLPSYTTLRIPGEDEGRIVAWDRIQTNTAVTGGGDEVLIDVLDAETNVAIEGLEALSPDLSGTIDVSDLDPTVYPSIKLRARFKGSGFRTDLENPPTTTVTAFQRRPAETYPLHQSERGEVFGVMYDSNSNNGNIVSWHRDPQAGNVWTMGLVGDNELSRADHVWSLDESTLLVYGRDDAGWSHFLGRRSEDSPDAWDLMRLDGGDGTRYDTWIEVIQGDLLAGAAQDRSRQNQYLPLIYERDVTADIGWAPAAIDLTGVTYGYISGATDGGVLAAYCNTQQASNQLCLWYKGEDGTWVRGTHNLPFTTNGINVEGAIGDVILVRHYDTSYGRWRLKTLRPSPTDPHHFLVYDPAPGLSESWSNSSWDWWGYVRREGDWRRGYAYVGNNWTNGLWHYRPETEAGLVFIKQSELPLPNADFNQPGAGSYLGLYRWNETGNEVWAAGPHGEDGQLGLTQITPDFATNAYVNYHLDTGLFSGRANEPENGWNWPLAWIPDQPLPAAAPTWTPYFIRPPEQRIGDYFEIINGSIQQQLVYGYSNDNQTGDYDTPFVAEISNAEGHEVLLEDLPVPEVEDFDLQGPLVGGAFFGYAGTENGNMATVWVLDPNDPRGWVPTLLDEQGQTQIPDQRQRFFDDFFFVNKGGFEPYYWRPYIATEATSGDEPWTLTEGPLGGYEGAYINGCYPWYRGCYGNVWHPTLGSWSAFWYIPHEAPDELRIVVNDNGSTIRSQWSTNWGRGTFYGAAYMKDDPVNEPRAVLWAYTGGEGDGHEPFFLPDEGRRSQVDDANVNGSARGWITKTNGAQETVLWFRTGATTWARQTWPNNAGWWYFDIRGWAYLVSWNQENRVMLYRPDGKSEPVAELLPKPQNANQCQPIGQHIQDRLFRKGWDDALDAFVAGQCYMPEADVEGSYQWRATVWFHDGTEWQVRVLPSGAGESRIGDALDGQRLLGWVRSGNNDYRPYMWTLDPTNPGTFTAKDLLPEGFFGIHTGVYDNWEDYISLSEDGVFMLPLYETEAHYQSGIARWVAYVPDAAEPLGFRTHVVTGPTDLWQSRPWNLDGTECWLVGDSGVSGLDSGPFIWGCAVGSTSLLEDWSVIYRTDRNPSIGFQLEVQDVCQQQIANTVSVATTSAEITTANNSSTATIGVDTVDLKVDMTADKGSVVDGEDVTYTVTVTNLGPGTGRNITISLLTPPQLGGSTATPPLPSRTWSLATLPRNATRTFTYTATVEETGQQVPLTSSVSLTHPEIDCVKSNNSASTTIVTGNNPNVWVRVTPPNTVRLFETGLWKVTYGNNGNTAASGVDVTFTMPLGVVVTDSAEITCSQANPAVCTLAVGDLPKDGTGSFVIEGQIDACDAVSSQRRSSATIDADLDVNLADNAASGSTSILAPAAQLSVAAVPTRATVETGDTVAWTIYFRNDGTQEIPATAIEATLPAGAGGLEVLSSSVTQGLGTYNAGTARWTLGALAPQAQGSVMVVAKANGGTGSPWTVKARGTGDNVCAVSADAAPVRHLATGGVQIVKTADTNATCGDGRISWRLVVTNTGASTADGLVVTDALPTGLGYVGGSIVGRGASDLGSPVLTWNVGTLAAGAAVTLGYETFAPSSDGTLVTNVAQVERAGAVLAASNPAAFRVDCVGQLELVKSWGGACAVFDTNASDGVDTNEFRVTIAVTNSGRMGAKNLVVRDWVPSCASVSNISDGGTCSAATSHVVWTLSDASTELAVGASRTLGFDLALPTNAAAGDLHLDKALATADGMPTQTSNLVAGVALSCNDGDPCTFDSCSPLLGCTHTLDPIEGASDATCDGVDDDCDGTTDDEFVGQTTSCGTGVCEANGRQTCVAGDIVDTCKPKAKASELDDSCNRKDDDCNGQTDDEFVKVATSCGVGACAATGNKVCNNGVVSDTCAPGSPTTEVCDNEDNDCDGLLDAADGTMVRVECDKQDGVCKGSMRPASLCVAGDWQSCPDAVYAGHSGAYSLTDTCDARDNDCDARVDEDFVAQTTTCGVGACGATGTTQCVTGQVRDTCQPGQPSTETCDGKDNDCDGLLDARDPNLVLVACEKQDGVCKGSMKTRELCVNGAFVPCNDGLYAGYAFPNYAATDDSCDSLDNDCSGASDEDYGTFPTTCGVGECGDNTGVRSCASGQVVDSCDPLAGAGAELCNDRDDDCDGATDEAFTLKGSGCDGADADQCQDGIWVCAANGQGLVCNDDAGSSTTELCDNVDNDCDGQIDEGCDDDGDDYCDGAMACVAGANVIVAACPNGCGDCEDADQTRNPGKIEVCNGIDDDCDGQVDEGCDDDGDDYCDATMGCDPTKLAPTCGKGCGDCADTNVAVNPGATELCDKLDNDCDGQIDEGYGTGASCTLGLGMCEASGVTVCASNKTDTICDAVPGTPGDERCNGLDDNCDGAVDEVFALGEDCVVGLGECRREGVNQCDPNTQLMVCSVPAGVPGLEVCDGRDNDCDGLADNNPAFPGVSICPVLETEITSGPPPVTASTEATFTYINPEDLPNLDFECSVDGGAWTDCRGGTLVLEDLVDGTHVLLVRAVGADGSRDPTPAYYQWEIDRSVPDTYILEAPANPSQTGDGTIVFGASVDDPDHYMCVLDPEASPPADSDYERCPTVYEFSDLEDGPHTMWVYVVDSKGTRDPSPATYTWVIDTTAPETVITEGPPKSSSATVATFDYEDPDSPETETFECRVDGGEWTTCNGGTLTLTGLEEGSHYFEVRTVDENGVRDPTPATYTWVVDDTPPDTFIPVHPDNPSQNPTALFGFGSDESPVTYRCVLDPALAGGATAPALTAYQPCDPTETFNGLEDGPHTIWVYATDTAGNSDPTPATYTWVIDTRFPETEITTGPTPLTGEGAGATFTYIDPTDPDLETFQCSLDGDEWEACDGGTTTYGSDELPVGTHTFQVRACDFTKPADVQCDPTPATWTWEVTTSLCPNDRVAPTMTCQADLLVECSAGGAVVDLDALRATASDDCEPVKVTTSSSAEVGLGTSPIVYVGTDGNGNVASCVTEVTVLDTLPPTIECPADMTASSDAGLCGAVLTMPEATVADACQGTTGLLVISDAPAFFQVGSALVTHRVVDASGNEAICKQKVTVTDDEPMTLTCTDSLEVDADPDKCEWTGSVTAEAVDNCAVDVTVLEVDGTYPVGESPVDFTATDPAGNTAECTTRLTVNDVTPPTVVCGEPVGVVPVVVRASALDACTAEVSIAEVSCAKVVGGVETPIAREECPIEVEGDALRLTGRLADGALKLVYTASAVDPSGNVGERDCELVYTADRDGDGIVDESDNCIDDPNTDQLDGDSDGVGDACDGCPLTADAEQDDQDGDGVGDACDNCRDLDNEDQSDLDGDRVGDACDVCPSVIDPEQADGDGDGVGDVCSDKDKDTLLDHEDNCPLDANLDQSDLDLDEVGDACDPTPYDGLTAEGSGGQGCSGSGGAGALGFALIALGVLVLRRRRA